MAEKETKVKIRPMEPEDIDGILAVDQKISGVQRGLTYRDLVREAIGARSMQALSPRLKIILLDLSWHILPVSVKQCQRLV